MSKQEGSFRGSKYGTYVGAWFCLLALTAITLAVARVRATDYAIAGPIIIATIKSGFVVVFFMHLRNEPWIVKIMLFLALLALALIILLTFTDVAFRDMRM